MLEFQEIHFVILELHWDDRKQAGTHVDGFIIWIQMVLR